MKLKYSARPAGYPVRDVVEIGFQLYRRLSGTQPVRDIVEIGYQTNLRLLSNPQRAVWQEKIHTGEFHTIFNGQFAIQLESKFQLDVPAATPEQIQLW